MVLIKRRSREHKPATPLKSLVSYGDGYMSSSVAFSPISSPAAQHSPESCTPLRFTFNEMENPEDGGYRRKRKQSSFGLPLLILQILVVVVILGWIGHRLVQHPFGRGALNDRLVHQQPSTPSGTTKKLSTPTSSVFTDVELTNRGQVVTTKAGSIKSHLQEESRRKVIRKYGPGPHRVRFTVEFTGTLERGSFVVEMAPLSLMPHAVQAFLDQVSLRLWDRTVFWHHDGIDHVISAAAVMYQTGDPRHHHFDAVGAGGLSFLEHSTQYPHEQYTLGFAGKGPEFYINARNNTVLHGGGSQHHPKADPCFAKVVEGIDVVLQMYELSLKQSRQAATRREWHDNELTHILQAEIL